MMVISTKGLSKQGVGAEAKFRFEHAQLDDVGKDVLVEGKVTKLEEGFLVQLAEHLKVDTHCDRCLKPMTLGLFGEAEEHVLQEPEEDSQLRLDGDAIDLTPLVTETAVLAWPAKLLCQEGCLGLCPSCGKDLNEETCSCTGAMTDPRFEALRNLHLEDD